MESDLLEKIKKIKERFSSFQQKSKDWKFSGDWLRSGIIYYVDPAGKEKTYETVERTTRSKPTGIDGVDIIPLVSQPAGKEKMVCLVAVYRPPVDRLSIEFPAGLLEAGESLKDGAARELAEETGHKGSIKFIGTTVHCDPWKSNESTVMCVAEVVEEKRVPLDLDDDEYLQPIEVPLRSLRRQLEVFQKNGFVIDARLYCFALGLEFQS